MRERKAFATKIMSDSTNRILTSNPGLELEVEDALRSTSEDPHVEHISQEETSSSNNELPLDLSNTVVTVNVTPSFPRRRSVKEYSDEDRAEVAKYALEHGNIAAIRHFETRFKLPESTVRSFKAKYLRTLEEYRKEGREEDDIVSLPIRKRGRKLGESSAKKPKKTNGNTPLHNLGQIFGINVSPATSTNSSKLLLVKSPSLVVSSLSPTFSDPSICTPQAQAISASITASSVTTPLPAPSASTPVVASLKSLTPLPAPPISSDSSSDESSGSPPRKKKPNPEKHLEVLEKILSEIYAKENKSTLDEETLFGMQVAANLRRLSSIQKANAKIKIQQVLYQIEFPTDT